MKKKYTNVEPIEKLELMQWGLKTSVVNCVNTNTGKAKILLIDNDYLIKNLSLQEYSFA